MKISICGTGRTGAAIAFALVLRQLGEEIVLVSRDPSGKAAGDALDLAHASLFLQPRPVRIAGGSLQDSAGSDIVIYTSSAQMQRVVTQVFRKVPTRINTSYEEHTAIANAVIAGDGPRAAELVVQHLERGKRLILSPRA